MTIKHILDWFKLELIGQILHCNVLFQGSRLSLASPAQIYKLAAPALTTTFFPNKPLVYSSGASSAPSYSTSAGGSNAAGYSSGGSSYQSSGYSSGGSSYQSSGYSSGGNSYQEIKAPVVVTALKEVSSPVLHPVSAPVAIKVEAPHAEISTGKIQTNLLIISNIFIITAIYVSMGHFLICVWASWLILNNVYRKGIEQCQRQLRLTFSIPFYAKVVIMETTRDEASRDFGKKKLPRGDLIIQMFLGM